jgi:hypothetical protein
MNTTLHTEEYWGVPLLKKQGRAIRYNLFCPKKGKKGFSLLSLTQKNTCHE